jgi:MFS family permease
MPAYVRTRLSAMMFLFYFALGAWAVTLSTYLMSAPVKGGLNFTTGEVGWVYSTFAIGGMTAPLFVGLLADRLFAVERILGVSGLACAALLFAAGTWCDSRFPVVDAAYRAAAGGEVVEGRPVLEQFARPDGDDALREQVRTALDRVNDDPTVRRAATETFRPLFALMLGVNFCVQIGLTLCAVMSLRNLADPPRQFSRTRMVGTVGWVAAGLAVAAGGIAVSSAVLYLSAAAALAFGLFAFTLPHTPPKGHGKTLAEAFGVPALRLLRDRSFCVFLAVGFVASAMNQFYGVYAHRYLTDLRIPRPELVLTVGQIVEVACMFAIPLLDPKRRMKALMLLGLAGWVLRSSVLAAGWVPAVVGVGVPMHGWSFAFYFVVAATYIDREAPPHLRASAQAIVSFAANGAAPWAGNMLAAFVVDQHRTGTVVEWEPVWLVPLAGSAAALVLFLFFFRPPPEQKP